jgi:hypothetical protein
MNQDLRRRAEDVIPGPSRRGAGTPPDDGHAVVVYAHGRHAPVRVVAGRVIQRGTAAELQRLVGLSEPALYAFAAARGWKIRAALRTGRK